MAYRFLRISRPKTRIGRVDATVATALWPSLSTSIRSDWAADIKARYTIETEAGALIMVNSEGLRHGPPEVIEKLARGENVDPRHYYFRTVMRFETAAPAVDWLNQILAIAKGQREPRAVRLDVYEVE